MTPLRIRLKAIIELGIAIAVVAGAVRLWRLAQRAADHSCVESVFYRLSQHPEFLSKVRVPVTNEWYQLDDGALTAVISALYREQSLDCKGIDKRMAKNRLGDLLRIQVRVSENESIRLRVMGAGRDLRMSSADDKSWESDEIKMTTHESNK